MGVAYEAVRESFGCRVALTVFRWQCREPKKRSHVMVSQLRASMPGNRTKWTRLLVATVTASPGWKAEEAIPVRTQPGSTDSGLAVGMPRCRTSAQKLAA
jgi:hypothetical protein